MASQAVGLATGIQDRFSWKGVALSALSGAVGGGMQAGKLFSGIGSSFVRGAVGGATANAVSQGVAVATGLQAKFDFAGVALAGIGSGAAGALGGAMGAKGGLAGMGRALGGFGRSLATNSAGGIANAAARSLIQGSDFGDNLIRALPDVIGSTVGNALAGQVRGRRAAAGGAGEISVTDWRGAGKEGALFEFASTFGNGVSSSLAGNGASMLMGGVSGSERARWMGMGPNDHRGNAVMIETAGDDPEIMIIGNRLPRSGAGVVAQGFLGRSIDNVQWALDGLSSWGSSWNDYLHSRYQSLTAGWGNGPLTLFADYQVGAAHRAVQIAAALPSAVAHPQRTIIAMGGAVDSWLMDNRSVFQAGRDNVERLRNLTPRQAAGGAGALAVDLGLARIPGRFVPQARFGAVRNAGIDAAWGQRVARMENIRAIGREAEAAVGLSGPKVRANVPGTGRYRVPDRIDEFRLVEVKNVAQLGLTAQLQDYLAITGGRLDFDLYVRGPSHPAGRTGLSAPLAELIRSGQINLKFIPGTE